MRGTLLSSGKKVTKNLCVTRKPIELKWEAALPPRGRENSRVRIGARAIRPLEYFPYGLASPARRGKAGSERRKACFHPGGSGFHLPRNVRSAFQFYSSSFYGHKAGSLFLSLYAPRFCLAASAGFGRQFTKLRALSRLRRRYDSRKKRILLSPVSFPIPPPCGQDWLPWCECSAGTPPDRPPACRPQSAA